MSISDDMPFPASSVSAPSGDQIAHGPLERELGYVMRRAQISIFKAFFAAFNEVDIKPAQYSALTIIEQNPGIAQGRVADALGIQKTNFVAMVSALESRGLLRRLPSAVDRRTYCLHLTGAGEQMMKDLHAIARDNEDRIRALVGSETYDRMFEPLWKIAQQLE